MPTTRFFRMLRSLPEEAKREWVLDSYGKFPMSLRLIEEEVSNNTWRGKEAMEKLGYNEK